MITRLLLQPVVTEVIQAAVSHMRPAGLGTFQVKQNTSASGRASPFTVQGTDCLMRFETQLLEECFRVRIPAVVKVISGSFNDQFRGQCPAFVPAHAIGNDYQVAVIGIRAQQVNGVLLFAATTDIRGYAELP
jgi:hypothetical protein